MVTYKEENAEERNKESNCSHVVPVHCCLYLKRGGEKNYSFCRSRFKISNSLFFSPCLRSLSLHQAIRTRQLLSREALLGNTSCKVFYGDKPNPTGQAHIIFPLSSKEKVRVGREPPEQRASEALLFYHKII